MAKYLFLLFFSFLTFLTEAQSASFGFEFMQRNNKLGGEKADFKKPDFYIFDEVDDTLGGVFDQYSITKSSFELPLYLRYKFKNRWYIDANYSTSKYNIELSGTANYDDNYYKQWNYTFAEFQALAQSNTGQTATYQQYQEYQANFKKEQEKEIEYKEEFKLNSFGLIAGYTFLPHKTVKPFLFGGFSYRSKVRQYTYQYSNIKPKDEWNSYFIVKDQTEMNNAILKFNQNSVVLRIGGGVETYRFRGGFSFDYCPLSQTHSTYEGGRVYRTKVSQPYNKFNSFTFYLSSDLITKDLKTKKQLTENSDIIKVDKLELKQTRNAFGVSVSKVASSNFNSYGYNDKPLTFGKLDQIYNFSGDSLIYTFQLQLISLGSITRVDWKPQIEGFYRRTFMKKFEWESGLAWQNLTLDMRTKELETKLTMDQNYNFQYPYKVRYYTGVYRTKYNIFSLEQKVFYTAIDKDYVKLKLMAGFSYAGFSSNVAEKDQQGGINSLSLAQDINDFQNGVKNDSTTYISQSLEYVDFNEPVETMINNYDLNSSYAFSWKTTNKVKQSYATYKLGAEAEFNRFLLGLNYEKTIGYFDGLLVKGFSRLSFSLGYLLYRK